MAYGLSIRTKISDLQWPSVTTTATTTTRSL